MKIVNGVRHETEERFCDGIQKVMACGVDNTGLENIFYNNACKFMGQDT